MSTSNQNPFYIHTCTHHVLNCSVIGHLIFTHQKKICVVYEFIFFFYKCLIRNFVILSSSSLKINDFFLCETKKKKYFLLAATSTILLFCIVCQFNLVGKLVIQLHFCFLSQGILGHSLERLFYINGFFCTRLKVGNLSFACAPALGSFGRHLKKNTSTVWILSSNINWCSIHQKILI